MKLVLSLTAILCTIVLLVGCGAPAINTESGASSSSSTTTTTTAASTTTKATSASSEVAGPTDAITTVTVPSSTSDTLSRTEAKSVALKHAGVNEADTFDFEIELDREGKTAVYDISFDTKSFEFEYDIDAVSGEVLRFKKEAQHSTSKPVDKSTSSKGSTTTTKTTTKPTGGWLTEAEAKAVVLKHAGVKEADIFDFDIELDRKGSVPMYDIDFETTEYEYEYHVFAENGKIDQSIRKKQDDKVNRTSSTAKPTTTSSSVISKDRAKDAAFKHAGVKAADAFDVEIELDRENKTAVYEISFETKQFDFDYTINANTGAVIRFEKEPHD